MSPVVAILNIWAYVYLYLNTRKTYPNPGMMDDGMNNVLSYLLTYLGYLNNVFSKGKTFSDFREGAASVASSRDAKS